MGKPKIDTTRELLLVEEALNQAAIVAITDVRGTIIHANDKFCQISKYSRPELLGQNHRILKSGLHPPQFFTDMWRTIANGRIWEGEIHNRAKDGSFYWVNTCIVPFLDANGKPYKYVSIRYDITKRKEIESQLISYANRLETSNQELQDFASVAAHDLQEPLRKVRNFADRLTKTRGVSGDDDARGLLESIQRSTLRMQTLINDLLAYSRVTAMSEPFERVDLSAIAQEVLSDLELRIEQSGGTVDLGPLPQIEADPAQMRQLFLNLIGNALKFQKPGIPPSVSITAASEGNECVISVSDNGIGFDAKFKDKIFGIFQRLHGRDEYEGTGIGLAICRRIVERHQGKISAESVSGQGASFRIELPLTQAKETF